LEYIKEKIFMNLKIGSKGVDVKKLQEKLGLKADGVFGPLTESKLIELQKKKGISPDGIVSLGTWVKLFGPITQDKPTPESKPSQPVVATTQNSNLSLEKLKGHVPDKILDEIKEFGEKFGISTNLRLAHFLSQTSHESGGFKSVRENLNYSAARLKQIFPKYFPGDLNESYAKNPQKIANKVYSSRMGNGDESSGDGWKFAGKGYIQLTGKSNYEEFDKMVDDDILANPDLVATKYPLTSAAFFFQKNKIWGFCDKGTTKEVVTVVTEKINGGRIGLDHRWSEFNKFHNLLFS